MEMKREKIRGHATTKTLEVCIMQAHEYRGVTYWCSPDGLCELPMDSGTACGSEDLLKDMIDVDAEVP